MERRVGPRTAGFRASRRYFNFRRVPESDSPLPLGAGVVIEYRKGRFEGAVCYCFFREIGYYVGVKFKPATRWSLREYRPRHLLDLKKLLTRRTAAKLKSVQ